MNERPSSRTRHLLFILSLVVLFVGGCELFAMAGYWALDREPFSYARVRAEQEVLATGKPGEMVPIARQQGERLEIAIHPYLGFVYSPAANSQAFSEHHGHPINRYGFIDSGPALAKRSDDRLIVGITGGSVAYWFSALGAETLVSELSRIPELRQREVVFVRLALGGFKQPQQLLALNWILSLGGELDILVNLDGYNEVVLAETENHSVGTFPFFPRQWHQLVKSNPSFAYLGLVGELFYARRVRRDWAATFHGSPAQHAVAMQLAWKARDRALERAVRRAQRALAAYRPPAHSFEIEGPGGMELTDGRLTDELAAQWMRCSIQMHRLSEANGIAYYHFLQPNQYLDLKPMGAAERRKAYLESDPVGPVVRRGYDALAARSVELTAAGVRFHDLRGVFEDVREPIYVDTCCHLNDRGNELLARAIAAAILEDHR